MNAAEILAKLFHDTYEELAPQFGYKTREASRKPWDQIPETNRKLMIAVCETILIKGWERIPKQDRTNLLRTAILNASSDGPIV